MKEPDLISNMREAAQPTIEKLKQTNINNNTNLSHKLDPSNKSNPFFTNATNNPVSNISKNNEKTSNLIKSHKFVFGVNQYEFPEKIKVLKCHNQIKELHTVLRDRDTTHSDFKFYSDRLIRLLVEEGLNQLHYVDCKVITPAGCSYKGVKYIKGVCGVSIMRSGEAMEKGLRECCRSIRIGKILIQSTDEDSKSVIYAKFPQDIHARKILLMYPITTTGSTINLAIKVLKEHGVEESNIILLCLFSTPTGLQAVNNLHPKVDILTSEIHPSVPTDFGQRYFGTE